jgi:protein phosphatase PTC7
MLLGQPTSLPSAFLRQRYLPRQVSSARFLSTSLALQSTTAPPAWRFETGYSFHGKPGSPVYRATGSPAPAEPEGGDNSGRPDWRTGRPKTLKQGLPTEHPLSVWRDAELAKAPWGAGHDWFFVEEQQEGRGVTVGVADGVGGWEESGIDPSHFSQALMWFAREAVRTEGFRSPKTLLDKAFKGVSNEKGVIAGELQRFRTWPNPIDDDVNPAGSSTACIISLDAATGLARAAK